MNAEALAGFLADLHEHKTDAAELTFLARATRAEIPPKYYSTLPSGDVFLCGEFLAFLTLTDAPAGYKVLWQGFANEMKAQISQLQLAYKAAADPTSLLKDTAKWLIKQFKDDDALNKAIMNPNSIFIKLNDVIQVETHFKWSQGNAFTIKTTHESFVFCQNIPDESNDLVSLYRTGKSMFTKTWQPALVSILQARAAQKSEAEAA